MKFLLSLCLLVCFVSCEKSCAPAKEPVVQSNKKVFFVNLKNGDKVTSPLEVVFGVEGMSVRKALEDLNDKTSGHHHILMDHPQGYIQEGHVIPMDDKHIHYGGAQTKGIINLSPGKHTLSLQFADGAHLSYGKALSATISVEVLE
jgi:hypothetical protein